MIIGDRVIGVLSIDKFEADVYTEELAEARDCIRRPGCDGDRECSIARNRARCAPAGRDSPRRRRVAGEHAEHVRSLRPDPVGASQGRPLPECQRPAARRRRVGDRSAATAIRTSTNWSDIATACSGPSDPAWELVERHETLILSDAAARYPQFEDVHVDGSIRSWMAVPLLIGDRLIGMLTFDSFEADFYTAEHANDGEGVCRVRRDGDRKGALRHRAPAGARGGGGGDTRRRAPSSRLDEPRDPHADERDHRHERTPTAHRPRRRATGVRGDHPYEQRSAPHDHQRHPRLLEGRGRDGWSSRSRRSTSEPASTACSRSSAPWRRARASSSCPRSTKACPRRSSATSGGFARSCSTC